ncbi:MAG TPA: hypothetical protein VH600_08265 [Burkholderiales bacterium]|jgi:hypothetical protein
MNPWVSAAVGALAGYAALALAALWLLHLCLPVSAHQVKWQCAATLWVVALAYFAACLVAAFCARRGAIASGLAAFAVLFLGHAVMPDLAVISFGKRWYVNEDTLLYAVIPAMVGLAVAVKRARRKAER